MDVLFLHGPAAAGKHTIGTLLSTLIDLPLFHNHLVVDAVATLFEFGSKGFVELRERIWLDAFSLAAETSRSFIFTFNPEASVDPALIQRLQDVVTSHHGRVLFVELECSEAAVIERLNSPSRAQFGKLSDVELYRSLKNQGSFDFPVLPEAIIVVDTEAQAPIESAHLIADAYRKA